MISRIADDWSGLRRRPGIESVGNMICWWWKGVSQFRRGIWAAWSDSWKHFFYKFWIRARTVFIICSSTTSRQWKVTPLMDPCNCSGWVPTCIGVATCGGLIVSVFSIHLFISARTSPITHFKAAIDPAVFCIYLATSPLGMVNLLLFILGTAPHHCCCCFPLRQIKQIIL